MSRLGSKNNMSYLTQEKLQISRGERSRGRMRKRKGRKRETAGRILLISKIRKVLLGV